MTAFECYKLYLALQQHFKSDMYDYFKYKGSVKAKFETFEKRRDVDSFLKISKLRDPKQFIIANFIYNESTWIKSFNNECQTTFEKHLNNGLYIFKEEITNLRKDFNENFVIDEDLQIPFVILLYRDKKISLFTLCVLERLLFMSEKWKKNINSILFTNEIEKISKTSKFFDVSLDKYKSALLEQYADL